LTKHCQPYLCRPEPMGRFCRADIGACCEVWLLFIIRCCPMADITPLGWGNHRHWLYIQHHQLKEITDIGFTFNIISLRKSRTLALHSTSSAQGNHRHWLYIQHHQLEEITGIGFTFNIISLKKSQTLSLHSPSSA